MQQFTKVILACDESGAKGYADQNETYPGEVGVFAGIMVPNTHLPTVEPIFKAIYDRYKPAAGKLHITDLDDAAKENLRREIYDAVTRLQLPCFWYAIHVAGLHAAHLRLQAVRQTAKEMAKEARDREPPRVKRGSSREEPASMHVELFAGLYAHLIAFLEERKRKLLEIEIRSDQIDSPIIKKFVSVAERLLSDDPTIKTVTGFDTIENKVVSGSISVKAQFPPDMQIDARVQELTIVPVGEGDGLVLAADVLANSLYYHFRNRVAGDLYTPLNSQAAIAGHPIAASLDAFWVWQTDYVGDGIYRHPSAP